VLTRVETTVTSDTTFFVWFRDTVLVSDERGVIHVCVRTAAAGHWIAEHYAAALKAALAGVGRARNRLRQW
jgi:hypothetical protein